MNTLTLKEKGFTNFFPLKEIQINNIPENTSNVIAIADTTPTNKSKSDILYIGKTKNLAKRIFGGYLAGYGGKTTQKIHTALFNEGYIEKTAISWMLTNNHKTTQKELLENFKKEHGNYPLWNTENKMSTNPQIDIKPKKTAKKAKTTPIIKNIKKPLKQPE
jgi:hypothetical protein